MNSLISNWYSFNFGIALILLLTYVLIDGMYAFYTISVVKKRPVLSATTGALMHFLIAFGVLSYIENYLYIIPLAIGSWIGTYLVVKNDFTEISQSSSVGRAPLS